MISFFSERTAEYALVPKLQKQLEIAYGAAYPIYYWKTREGNSVSSRIHGGNSVKVLAMFARRPKSYGEGSLVFGKINARLAEFANAARSLGIPTIAGFPAVDSIGGLYTNPTIFWLPIEMSDGDDCHFQVDLSVTDPVPINSDGSVIQTLTFDEIIRIVERQSLIHSWDIAMKHISMLRAERFQPDWHWFSWFSGYKPVYFLIPTPC